MSRKPKNPFLKHSRDELVRLYADALSSHEALDELFFTRITHQGYVNRLSSKQLTAPGALEVATAVCVADYLKEDWPVVDLLRSTVEMNSKVARYILADWLDRKDERQTPSHLTTKREHILDVAAQMVESLTSGMREDDAIHRVAQQHGLPAATLKNHIKGRRGSSRRIRERL